MRHKHMSVSRAKARLLELTRKTATEGEAYLLTKDGEPVGALVPIEYYESLLETADVLADSQTLKDLEAALEDERKGHLWRRDKRGKWVRKKTKRRAA